MTLLLWGYVHFTYIISSEDCLINVSKRPFPHDVILQVEVYSNTSEIWYEREKALQDLYHKIYDRSQSQDFNKESERNHFFSTGWIKDYCESSFFINLTGTNFYCQFILTELFNFSNTKLNGENPVKNIEPVSGEDNNKCAQENFYEWISKAKMTSANQKCITEAELTIAAFYSRNYSLYDLFDLYGR